MVDGDPKPTVTWMKNRNMLQDGKDAKIYYDQAVDAHFMEISNCKPKDAGTYQVTATNEFGSEIAPVTLIITQNPNDVVDLKAKLKVREGPRRAEDNTDPDWGKLRKGSVGARDGDQGGDQVKLRHIERPEQIPEEIVQDKVAPVIKIYYLFF